MKSASSLGTAAAIAKEMGKGINLGMTLERKLNSRKEEGIHALLKTWKAAGIKNVRIPVTWFHETDNPTKPPTTLFESDDDGLLPKVVSSLNALCYALEMGFYVILNTHHEEFLYKYYTGSAEQDEAFANLWTKIAERYKDADEDRLLFEVLNEPQGNFGDTMRDKKYARYVKANSEEGIRLTRQINKVGFEAIRQVSPNRVVLLAPNGRGNWSRARLIYPKATDLPGGGQCKRIMVTLHTYDPWGFCGPSARNRRKLTSAEVKDIMVPSIINGIKTWLTGMGGPAPAVHIGEYGVGRVGKKEKERDTGAVRDYYTYITRA
ncbi:unnamed protein product, partial [Chrysoparadoxa australica]